MQRTSVILGLAVEINMFDSPIYSIVRNIKNLKICIHMQNAENNCICDYYYKFACISIYVCVKTDVITATASTHTHAQKRRVFEF